LRAIGRRFRKTGWWCAQSDANRTPTGKLTGNFEKLRLWPPGFSGKSADITATSATIPWSSDQGIVLRRAGNFGSITGISLRPNDIPASPYKTYIHGTHRGSGGTRAVVEGERHVACVRSQEFAAVQPACAAQARDDHWRRRGESYTV